MKKKIYSKLLAATLIAAMATMSLAGCGTASQDGTLQGTTEAAGNENKIEQETEAVSEKDSTNEESKDTSGTTNNSTKDEASKDTTTEKITDEAETVEANEADNTNSDAPLTAKQFTENIVIGWNLGNTLDAFAGQAGQLRNDGLGTETCWGNPKTSKELIDCVKGYGFNVIRVPVTWYTHMDHNTYEIDSEWMNRVHEVVDYALDDNTYVILNMHHDTGTDGWLHASDNNLDQKKAIFESAWTQIASSFADYDENLVFEGFNEILDDNNEWSKPDKRSVEIVNELNQIFVDTVRKTGGQNDDRVLIVNTYCAGNDNAMLNYFEVPADTVEGAICAEVHAYCPYYFTAPESPDVKTWSENDVKTVFQNVKTKFQLLKTPVIIGEFGAVDKNNTADRLAYFDYFVSTAKTMGLKCIIWDNGITREYGIIDRNGKTASQKDVIDTIVAAANK